MCPLLDFGVHCWTVFVWERMYTDEMVENPSPAWVGLERETWTGRECRSAQIRSEKLLHMHDVVLIWTPQFQSWTGALVCGNSKILINKLLACGSLFAK